MMMSRFAWRVLVVVLFLAGCGTAHTPPAGYEGPSSELNRTVVLATLDEPIPEGKNAIWCASFEASWKELIDFVGEPIALSGDPPMAQSLNEAPDPRPVIPEESLYVLAGRGADGAVEQMRREMAAKFPNASLSILPAIDDSGITAYAYLEADVPFGIPYFQHNAPLAFNESNGAAVNVTSFGIRKKDHDAYVKLRGQAHVIPVVEGPADPERPYRPRPALEYALDLDVTSYPSQVIVAKVSPEPSLQRTVEKVEAKAKEAEARVKNEGYSKLGLDDTVFVPDVVFRIAHHFAELEGRMPANAKLENVPLMEALQVVQFRLTRSGAELRSEAAQLYRSAALPQDYIFDGPFLIYMKKRGADRPYFAMWVDNAELLQPWKK
jgi:hypothetical protein